MFCGDGFYQAHLSFFKSENVPVEMVYRTSTKHNKKMQRAIREKELRSNKTKAVWDFGNSEASESFQRLLQVNSGKTVAAFRCNSPFAYFVHVVWLSSNAKQRRYLTEHGRTMLGVHPAR